MRIRSRSAVALALMLATVMPASSQTSAAFPVTYVVLGAEGPVARAVYPPTATACPQITLTSGGGTNTQTMSVRALPQTGNPPAGNGPWFPVLVCELPIPPGTTGAAIGDRRLPLPPPPAGKLESFAVIGDTGCRLKDSKKSEPGDADAAAPGKFQDCDKQSTWPFSTLAAHTAAQNPQLLVHVGDYIYREVLPYGDNWDTWNADFFTPARPLLDAAPWIATRGNHENCERNGVGFMLFLDPTLATGQKPPACIALLDPIPVTVGGQQFMMLDSSNAPDECVTKKKDKKKKKEVVCDAKKNLAPNCPESGCSVKDYADQFAAMKPAKGAWLVTHRPVWGFKEKGKPLNKTLQQAIKANWDGELPPHFALSVAGHIHIWEALSFKDKGAPQLVLGNGGTLLTSPVTRKLKGEKAGKRTVRASTTSHKWGFTIFKPTSSGGWDLTAYEVPGSGSFTCKVEDGTVSCP